MSTHEYSYCHTVSTDASVHHMRGKNIYISTFSPSIHNATDYTFYVKASTSVGLGPQVSDVKVHV